MAYLKKITVLKWIVYSLITFNCLIMYMDINENYTIRILGSVFCPAFGSNWRCEILSMVGIYGFFCGLILLMTGVIGTKKKTKLLNNLNKTESISCFFHTIVFIFFLGHSMSWMKDVHSQMLVSRMPGYLLFNIILFFIASILSVFDCYKNI